MVVSTCNNSIDGLVQKIGCESLLAIYFRWDLAPAKSSYVHIWKKQSYFEGCWKQTHYHTLVQHATAVSHVTSPQGFVSCLFVSAPVYFLTHNLRSERSFLRTQTEVTILSFCSTEKKNSTVSSDRGNSTSLKGFCNAVECTTYHTNSYVLFGSTNSPPNQCLKKHMKKVPHDFWEVRSAKKYTIVIPINSRVCRVRK